MNPGPLLKIVAMLAMMLVPLAQAQTDNTPSNITFLDTVYSLEWTSGSSIDGSMHIYLPEDESLPYYHNLLRVEHNPEWSVTEAVQGKMQFLQTKTSNSAAKILELAGTANPGEILLVFVYVMQELEREGGKSFANWSAYRYMPMQSANGRQEGFHLFEYSRRYYYENDMGNNIPYFLQHFLEENDRQGNEQAERIHALTRLQIP